MKSFMLFDIFGCPGKLPLSRLVKANSAIEAVMKDMNIQDLTASKQEGDAEDIATYISSEGGSELTILVIEIKS